MLIFDYLEISQALRIYEENIIQRWICQNSHSIKNILSIVILLKVIPSVIYLATQARFHDFS